MLDRAANVLQARGLMLKGVNDLKDWAKKFRAKNESPRPRYIEHSSLSEM